MSKTIKSNIKFNAFATKVTAGPPIGPILGQQGIPIMDFCKAFNNETTSFNKDLPLRVRMTVYTDKTYEYTIGLPSVMFFVKHIQNHTGNDTISMLWVYEIARIKSLDLKVAKIIVAEKVRKTKKLMRLTVDLGQEQRTVVSGIAEDFSPEDLIGKQVTLLTNLHPRTLKGIESNGMILLGENVTGSFVFVNPENKETKTGLSIH